MSWVLSWVLAASVAGLLVWVWYVNLVVKRPRRVIQAAALTALAALVLGYAFPEQVEAKGSLHETLAIVFCYGAMLLGMAAQYRLRSGPHARLPVRPLGVLHADLRVADRVHPAAGRRRRPQRLGGSGHAETDGVSRGVPERLLLARVLRGAPSGARLLDPAVGVTGEAAAIARVDRRVLGKRPAAELRAPVVLERLLQFGAGVHHEGPVLRDRLADRPPLQQQHFGARRRRPRGAPPDRRAPGWRTGPARSALPP